MKTDVNHCVIRGAEPADSKALTHLFHQLGYPSDASGVMAGLTQPDPAREVLVACLGEEVVGVLVWHRMMPLHVPAAWGLISALVVDEEARGRSVGAQLLAAAEARAQAAGCSQLELSSSLKREGAHRFYLAQGYLERPKRFVKVF